MYTVITSFSVSLSRSRSLASMMSTPNFNQNCHCEKREAKTYYENGTEKQFTRVKTARCG